MGNPRIRCRNPGSALLVQNCQVTELPDSRRQVGVHAVQDKRPGERRGLGNLPLQVANPRAQVRKMRCSQRSHKYEDTHTPPVVVVMMAATREISRTGRDMRTFPLKK